MDNNFSGKSKRIIYAEHELQSVFRNPQKFCHLDPDSNTVMKIDKSTKITR